MVQFLIDLFLFYFFISPSLVSVLCSGRVQRWRQSADGGAAVQSAGEDLQLLESEHGGACRHPDHPAPWRLGTGLCQPHQRWADGVAVLTQTNGNMCDHRSTTVHAVSTAARSPFCKQMPPTKPPCLPSREASLPCVWTEWCRRSPSRHTAVLLPSRCCMEEEAGGTAPTAGLTRPCR